MATVARRGLQAQTADEAWELPENRPLLVRIARPWLQNPIGLVGLVIVVAFVFLGIFGPYIAPYDPDARNVSARFLGPSMSHPFGTNSLGKDMLSRVMAGSRVSLTFGTVVLFVGFLPGTALG